MNYRALHDALPRNPSGVVVHHGSEHQEQKALFRWLDSVGVIEPRLRLAFAIPNGGDRNLIVAKKLKAEGVKAGVPDICLPVPSGPYAGLYVELKVKENEATEMQRHWLELLHDQGYAVTVQHGWTEAAAAIVEYLTDAESFVSGP